MDWLSITLAMAGGATLTVGVICLLSYVLDRSLRGHLMFSVAAMSVSALAFCELRLLGTTDAESYAWWMHWAHVPLFAALVSIAWFVRLWMCTGRMWLLWAVTLLRGLILVLNFVYVPNFNYAELTSVERVMLPGGVEASVPEGVISRRSRLGELSVLLLIVFVVDATVSAWRGRVGVERYGALLTGGGVTAFVLLGVVMTALTHRDWVSMPYLISLGFLLPVMAMGMQLSGTVERAAMLSQRLDENVKALESSGRQLGLALAAGQMGVWEWDMVADRIVLNEQGCQLLGVSGRTSLGLEEFLALVDPEDRERVRGAIRTSVGGDGEYAVEYRVGGEGGGSGRWLAVRGCVEFSRDGRAEVMRGVGYDITYRKMSEELFRSVVEASASAMIVVDGAGRVVEVNSRSEGMFGYVREELLGRQVEDLVPASLRASHAALRDTYATDPEARQMGLGRELMALRKDGTEFPAEISLSPIRAMDQWLVLATVVDITERRRLERERAAQRNELAHLSRVAVLGELSGSLAHELNQPLAAILSNAQAAQRMMETGQADGGELVDILQETVDEDRRASEVIRRLWSLFRNGDVAHEPIDLNEQVVEAVRLVESEPRHHGIGVRVELAKGLPRVAADRVQVQQVVINLLMNAMDALSGRGVEGGSGGQITVVTGREEDGLVFVEVRDNGPGIAEADLPRLFEPFFTTKAQGLGLGLHICQTIATSHGGRMRAWNGEAGGAVLRMSLRCAILT